MSYTVKYEDGDVENRVKRGHIAPFPHEVRRSLPRVLRTKGCVQQAPITIVS